MPLRSALPQLSFALALAAVYTTAFWITSILAQTPAPATVATALTLDLTLGVPLLYYLLLVRRKGWPVLTVVPVFLLSLLAASALIPAEHQALLHVLRYLVAPLEVGLLGAVGYIVVRTARRFRRSPAEADVLARLQASLRATIPVRRVAEILAFEIALIYYACFSWRAPSESSPRHAFSYHRRSGYGAVVGGILFVLLLETIALHVLLHLWSPPLAWILTGLSLYGVLWMVGDFQAVRQRPLIVADDTLHVRTGLRWTVDIPFEAVAWIRTAKHAPHRDTPGYLDASLLRRPTHWIALKQPLGASGLYGLRRDVTLIGLAPDDPDAFEAALAERFEAWRASI